MLSKLVLLALLGNNLSTLAEGGNARYLRSASSAFSAASSPSSLSSRKTTSSEQSSSSDYVLRWAASGGGWRAMVTHMSFANVFAQAGLLGSDSTEFSAISSNSGGSWFTTQLFYSPEFYSQVVNGDGQQLSQFVAAWMNSYLTLQSGITGTSYECEAISAVASELFSEDACNVLHHFNGSWADFVQAMLQAASTQYSDPTFVDRAADFNNRVPALQSTDLYVQMGIAQAAVSGDTLNYIAPNDDIEVQVYNVPVGLLHTVKVNQTAYSYGVNSEDLPLEILTSEAPHLMIIDEWTSYVSSPPGAANNGSVLTFPVEAITAIAPLNNLFGGTTPTVTQVASASSASDGGLSGASPASLVQYLSLLELSTTSELKKAAIDALGSLLYLSHVTDDLAVCSQWPNDCGTTDVRLLDGAYIDNNAVAMSIGEYQTTDDGDLTKTLKLVLTKANFIGDTNSDSLFLSYFATTFNQGVTPGDYIWPIANASAPASSASTNTPIMSVQIFAEEMTLETLESLRVPVTGTNLTTAVVTATTVDNAAFGTKAGQKVEILYLETHSSVPTQILGVNSTQTWTPVLETLSSDIAVVGSAQLIKTIQAFLAM